MAGGFPIKTSAFLVFGFVGIIGGSGMGAGWSCPHIYWHIRYMCHLCFIAIGRQDFRLLTSNGVSTLLYLSYIWLISCVAAPYDCILVINAMNKIAPNRSDTFYQPTN